LLSERSFSMSASAARARARRGGARGDGVADCGRARRMRRDGDGDGARDVARPAYEDAYEDAVAALERALARRARAALEGDDGGTTAREWTPEDGAEAAARVLETCGAHYTAWAFRMRCVEDAVDAREAEAGTATLRDELAFAEAQTTKNPKNYQVWNHARMVLERADAAGAFEGLRDGAFAHANAALMLDGKNIHAWSHRAWLVERCDAWEEEMAFTEEMLAEDWMNNSAWNARFQCVTVCLERGDVGVLEREAAFATTAPRVDDDNESAWNYLRGLCAIAERDGSAIPRDVANRVVALAIDAARTAAAPAPSRVPSRHAALLLADRVAAEAVRDADIGRAASAESMFRNLATLDPLRGNYYRTRIDRLRAALA
jgi:protein farnesyltransferase/geranylgeranyltransferase type-1 subunit alpha